MKKLYTLLIVSLIYGCNQSELKNEFDCKTKSIEALVEVKDYHQNFKTKLPKHWKTNLYFDEYQSSIYAADTTLQLTNSFLIDFTMVEGKLNFTKDFQNKFSNQLLQQQLLATTTKKIQFKSKEAFLSKAEGVKGAYPYQICNLYVKVNELNYLHVKAEVYGDSLVDQRMCTLLNLIEKVTF